MPSRRLYGEDDDDNGTGRVSDDDDDDISDDDDDVHTAHGPIRYVCLRRP